MIPIGQTLLISRRDVAKLIGVSVGQLEVWQSNGKHTILHRNTLKLRGRCHYHLSDVAEFLKEWDKERYYEIHTNDGKGFINWLTKYCFPPK